MIPVFVLGQFPPPPADAPAEIGKNLFPSFSSISLSPFIQFSRWKRDRGRIKTAKKMTSEVGRHHRQKKQQKKNTHIHQDKETKRDAWQKLDYEGKRGGSGGTRLQTEEFQYTT